MPGGPGGERTDQEGRWPQQAEHLQCVSLHNTSYTRTTNLGAAELLLTFTLQLVRLLLRNKGSMVTSFYDIMTALPPRMKMEGWEKWT